jgi:hypothetical protein
MTAEPGDFDMGAAWLRRSQGDLKAFMSGLAARLDGALPGRVTVDRQRNGWFSSESHVTRIVVTLERGLFTLADERGHLVAKRAKIVRGITIGTETMPVPAWLTMLNEDIHALGEEAGAAHAVLHDFLMS